MGELDTQRHGLKIHRKEMCAKRDGANPVANFKDQLDSGVGNVKSCTVKIRMHAEPHLTGHHDPHINHSTSMIGQTGTYP